MKKKKERVVVLLELLRNAVKPSTAILAAAVPVIIKSRLKIKRLSMHARSYMEHGNTVITWMW